MKSIRVWPGLFILLMVMSALGFFACAEDDEDDDDDNPCDGLVDDPLTDCNLVCTEEICVIVMECEILGEIANMETCLSECQRGCNMGCLPVGTMECIQATDNCDALVNCMLPLFNY